MEKKKEVMMKLQLASDLHLEFSENRKWLRSNPLIAQADTLILAGDTVPFAFMEKADFFYDQISGDFDKVITICGNHEFYKGDVGILSPSYRKMIRDNIYVINNQTLELDNVYFICSTLWTDVPAIKQREVNEIMNDYRLIRYKRNEGRENFSVEDMLALYHESLDFIKEELIKHQGDQVVVITHHVPVYQTMPKTYRESILRYCYGNDLSTLIEENPQIKLWVNGHCHYPDRTQIKETLLYRNPLGYVLRNQQENFQRDLVIEI